MYNQVGVLAQSETTAKAACIIERETGRVLFSCDMHTRLPMASTTKVMTALLALELGDLDAQVTCPKSAYGVPGTSIYLQEGETLSLHDLLKGLMLASGNDAAAAIAAHIGGSEAQFVEMMNARARAIGAHNTHFANPHGLPNDTHYTTAYDLALIAREAMENERFRELVITRRDAIPWQGRTYSRQLTNKNRLLTTYEGATGIKTGYTSKAGRCLVFGAARGDLELVGVVLGCADWFDEAERLMDGCFDTYTMACVLAPAVNVGQIAVTGGMQERVNLLVMDTLCIPLAAGECAQVVLDIPQIIEAPVRAGQPVGTASVVVGGEVYGTCEVVAARRVQARSVLLNMQRIIKVWMM